MSVNWPALVPEAQNAILKLAKEPPEVRWLVSEKWLVLRTQDEDDVDDEILLAKVIGTFEMKKETP